jgi:hypothetical protein
MPTEEVVVHRVLESDDKVIFFEDIVKQILVKDIPVIPTVNWIDGIAFAILGFPDTEDVVREELKGRIHYSAVLFTKISYQPEIVVNLGKEDIRVRLRKADTNPDFVDLVEFLKTFKRDPRVNTKVTAPLTTIHAQGSSHLPDRI